MLSSLISVNRKEVNKTLEDITDRWKNVKVEITSVKTSLEETVEYWKRYNACVDLFHVWLSDAETMLKKTPEERGVCVIYVLVATFFALRCSQRK